MERKIRTKIINHLKKEHWLVLGLSDKWRSGIPDLICMKNGQTIFLEIKDVHGVVAPIQEHTISVINNHGVEAYVVRSVDEVKEILERRKYGYETCKKDSKENS